MIGHVLQNAGYNTAVIAQPDVNSPADITRLGEPKLFWGVSAGSVDSMVANYTASKKPRKSDDYTPGGVNNRRPDRACMVYTNLIRRNFKNTKPIMLGGIEASLRRVAHYDFWNNKIRGSILFDAKADYLIYGMGEKSVLEFAFALSKGLPVEKIRHDLSEEKLHEIFGDTWKTLPDEVYKRLRFCPSKIWWRCFSLKRTILSSILGQ